MKRPSKVGNAIRQVRLAKTMSQESLGIALDVSKSYISAIETGKRPLQQGMARQMINLFKPSEEISRILLGANGSHKISIHTDGLSGTKINIIKDFAKLILTCEDRDARKVGRLITQINLNKESQLDNATRNECPKCHELYCECEEYEDDDDLV